MNEGSHWYDPVTGEPKHFVPKKDGTGTRPTTIKDARANGWVPGVSTVLRVLAKPQLVDWIVQQNVLAAVTTLRLEGESLDDFVKRIMDKDARAETDAARDRGTEMHAALELLFQGRGTEVDDEMLAWVYPAAEEILNRFPIGAIHSLCEIERVVVGDGYAGKVDLMHNDTSGCLWLWDWKTTKKLPKGEAWPEHRLQLSAYAQAVFMSGKLHPSQIRTGNVYISTVEQGTFVVCEHVEPWPDTYLRGFLPLLTHWVWSTGYSPRKSLETATKCL